jgi:hypothetical protein
MVTTVNNTTTVINEFPSNQFVSLFKHTIWDRYTGSHNLLNPDMITKSKILYQIFCGPNIKILRQYLDG